MESDDDKFMSSGVGIRPDILAGCRRRNREAERREAAEKAGDWKPRPPRPGRVYNLTCGCGHTAGFRVEGDFQPTKVCILARKIGWSIRTLDKPFTCASCAPKESAS